MIQGKLILVWNILCTLVLVMSLSKLDLATTPKEEWRSTKITVKALKTELANVKKSLQLVNDSYKRTRTERDEFKKLNATLIATVQAQNELLKSHNLEMAPAPKELTSVVDPVVTLDSLKKLRQRNAELSRLVEEYRTREEVDENDVMKLLEYQHMTEVLLAENEELNEGRLSNQYKRRIDELSRNVEMLNKLNQSLVHRLNVITEKESFSLSANKKIPKNAMIDSALLRDEVEIDELKRQKGTLRTQINELEIELRRISDLLERTLEKGKSQISIQTMDEVYAARLGEVEFRKQARELRMENAELKRIQTTHDQTKKDLENKIADLEKTLKTMKQENEDLKSRIESIQMAEDIPGMKIHQSIISLRKGEASGFRAPAARMSSGPMSLDPRMEHRDRLSSAPVLREYRSDRPLGLGSLHAIASTPGLMSTGRQGASGPFKSRSSASDNSRDIPIPRYAKPMSAPPPSAHARLLCPRCNQKFPGDRVEQYQIHVDQCYR